MALVGTSHSLREQLKITKQFEKKNEYQERK